MPGTFARDSLAPNLIAGATLNAAGTTASSITDLDAGGTDVQFELVTSTVASTGNTATLSVEVEASDSSTFASGVVSLGRFDTTSGTDAAQTNMTRKFTVFVPLRYIRLQVTLGGTAPVYTGTTVKPRTKHDRRTKTTTA